jgi:hypothetical protein
MVRCVYPPQEGSIGSAQGLRAGDNFLKKASDRIALCKKYYKGPIKNPITFAFVISNKFKCGGWDSPEFLNKHRPKGNEYWDKLYPKELALNKLIDKMRKKFSKMDKFFVDKEKGIITTEDFNNRVFKLVFKLAALVETNRELISTVDVGPELRAIKMSQFAYPNAVSMFKKIQQEEERISEEIRNYVSSKETIARNQAMIETIEKLKGEKGQILIFSGYQHIFTKELKYDQPIRPEDSFYELRKYFETIPSVITTPKQT